MSIQAALLLGEVFGSGKSRGNDTLQNHNQPKRTVVCQR